MCVCTFQKERTINILLVDNVLLGRLAPSEWRWCHFMSLYEVLMVLIGFGSLLITLIALVITLINRFNRK